MSLTHHRVRPTSLSDTRDPDVNLAGWVLTNSAGNLTKWAQEMAPIIGELLFRGYVFRVMQRAWSPKNAIAASALLFAIVHPGLSLPLAKALARDAPSCGLQCRHSCAECSLTSRPLNERGTHKKGMPMHPLKSVRRRTYDQRSGARAGFRR